MLCRFEKNLHWIASELSLVMWRPPPWLTLITNPAVSPLVTQNPNYYQHQLPQTSYIRGSQQQIFLPNQQLRFVQSNVLRTSGNLSLSTNPAVVPRLVVSPPPETTLSSTQSVTATTQCTSDNSGDIQTLPEPFHYPFPYSDGEDAANFYRNFYRLNSERTREETESIEGRKFSKLERCSETQPTVSFKEDVPPERELQKFEETPASPDPEIEITSASTPIIASEKQLDLEPNAEIIPDVVSAKNEDPTLSPEVKGNKATLSAKCETVNTQVSIENSAEYSVIDLTRDTCDQLDEHNHRGNKDDVQCLKEQRMSTKRNRTDSSDSAGKGSVKLSKSDKNEKLWLGESSTKNCEDEVMIVDDPETEEMSRSEQGYSTVNDSKREGAVYKRKWERTDFAQDYHSRKKSRQQKLKNFMFSVASYNVLAQRQLDDHHYLYKDCEPFCLTWKHRKMQLLKEIRKLKPDVLCMQEVQEDHYHNFFHKEFKVLGYEGVYKKRTGDKPDGCATFYQVSKFHLVNSVPVEYLKPGIQLLDRDNVGLILLLQARQNDAQQPYLCVANTHLLYNPRRGDVKLAQLQVLLAEIEKLAYQADEDCYHPVIICGDFNLLPNSNVYDFLLRGSLEFVGLPVKGLTGQEGYSHSNNLGKTLLPQTAGISDECQFVEEVSKRSASLLSQKQEAGNSSQEVDVTDAPSLEEGEIIDVSSEDEQTKGERNSEKDAGKSSYEDMYEDPAIIRIMSSPTDAASSASGHSRKSDQSEEITNHCPHGTGTLCHQFQLNSVYSHVSADSRKNEVTTCHSRVNCTVDYIFYLVRRKRTVVTRSGRIINEDLKEGELRLLEKLALPCGDELNERGGLPNVTQGSDHVMLAAKFLLELKS